MVKALFNKAEKHIGKKYVFGVNGPNNFDCSSFVCWSFTHSGVKKYATNDGLRDIQNLLQSRISKWNKGGSIIFFKNTYDSGFPISYVGIYAVNGIMIHAGDSIY